MLFTFGHKTAKLLIDVATELRLSSTKRLEESLKGIVDIRQNILVWNKGGQALVGGMQLLSQ